MADNPSHEEHNRWRVKLDPTVNLGHIITALVFLTTAVAGWATLDSRQARSEEKLASIERWREAMHQERIADVRQIASMQTTLSNVEQSITRMSNQVNALFQDNRRQNYERN